MGQELGNQTFGGSMTSLHERSASGLDRFVSLQIILICGGALLYSVDDVLRVGRVGSGVAMQLITAAATIFILLKIRKRKQWARRLFIILCALGVPFIPAMVASPQGGLIYASNTLLASLQRITNLGSLVVGIAFVAYLFKPSVRALFSSAPPKVYQRVLLAASVCLLFVMGLVGLWGARQVGEYVRIEGEDVRLTEKGKALLAPEVESDRAAATELLKLDVPAWGFVDDVVDAEGFDVVALSDFSSGQAIALFVSESAQARPLEDMLTALDQQEEEWLARSPSRALQRRDEGAGRWLRLSPTVTGDESFLTGSGSIGVQRVEFRALDDGRQEGVQVTTQKNGRPVTILAYGESLDKQAVQDFLDQFLSSGD